MATRGLTFNANETSNQAKRGKRKHGHGLKKTISFPNIKTDLVITLNEELPNLDFLYVEEKEKRPKFLSVLNHHEIQGYHLMRGMKNGPPIIISNPKLGRKSHSPNQTTRLASNDDVESMKARKRRRGEIEYRKDSSLIKMSSFQGNRLQGSCKGPKCKLIALQPKNNFFDESPLTPKSRSDAQSKTGLFKQKKRPKKLDFSVKKRGSLFENRIPNPGEVLSPSKRRNRSKQKHKTSAAKDQIPIKLESLYINTNFYSLKNLSLDFKARKMNGDKKKLMRHQTMATKGILKKPTKKFGRSITKSKVKFNDKKLIIKYNPRARLRKKSRTIGRVRKLGYNF